MNQQRRQYTREYKVEAVRLITEAGHPAAAVARDLGIDAKMLRRWKQELTQEAGGAFPGSGHLKPEEELIRLRRENARLQQELAFLKKTAAYFARQNGSGTP